MTSWFDTYKEILNTAYSSFSDYHNDTRKLEKNYVHILADIIGIFGILLCPIFLYIGHK